MARKKKAKSECKRFEQADARYDAKIASAKEEMMKNKKPKGLCRTREQVRMNRNALLARQAKALEERNAWQKRMALLAELETAVKHERQMYQKERRKMEWERKQRTIFLREQLPGPGEYEVPTTIERKRRCEMGQCT